MQILKIFFNKLFNKNKKGVKETLETIDLCINVYKKINTKRLFTPEELYSKEILVIFKNIEEYISNIEKFKERFENESLIKAVDIPYDVYPILLEDFFVSKDNCYLPTTTYLDVFQKVVIDWCQLVKRNNDSIVFLHNKRITTNVVENLLVIGQEILHTQKVN